MFKKMLITMLVMLVATSAFAGDIDTKVWITHRLSIQEVPTEFDKFTDPKLGAIKAVIEVQ